MLRTYVRTFGSLRLYSFLYRAGRDVTGDASLLLLAIKLSVHRCVTERYHSLSHRLQQHPTLHSLVPAVCRCVFLRWTRVVLGGFIRAPLSGTARPRCQKLHVTPPPLLSPLIHERFSDSCTMMPTFKPSISQFYSI